jgi:alpha-beta hydrolase superfamily lysophospholipase
MSRLTLPVALIIAVGVALPGCAKNKTLPTQLAPSRMTSIGVNAYLWRAAVDTLSFAPLVTADSSGGVIVTDWYANPTTPGERVKLTVSIIDQDLRADALKVAASRQVNQGGVWVDAPVAAATVQKLEDIILTRARDLRRTSVGG